MSSICPRCGFRNWSGAQNCANCRWPLQLLPALPCPQCSQALRSNASFCSRCGHQLGSAAGLASNLCPHCRTPNRPDAGFCQGCGRSLQLLPAQPLEPCPRCGEGNRQGATFCQHCAFSLQQPVAHPVLGPCSHCGTGNRPGARFCQHCGRSPSGASSLVAKRYQTGMLPAHHVLYGETSDEYVVVRMIAKGGMGAVYRVVRTRDQTQWALKEMSESVIEPGERQQTIAAFRQEADLLKRLDHENLPKVIDVFEGNGRQCMVMDFIDGHTLHELIEQSSGPLPEQTVLGWATQLCVVLDNLHDQQPPIIYRDLKPDNIMLETATDTIKLIDFGIARRYKSDKTKDTVLLGTPGYAAPEQYGRGQTDARSDVYALGATLHHLLTNHDPSSTPFRFDPIEQYTCRASKRVCGAIMKAVEKMPEDRPESAAEFYEALLGKPLPAQAKPIAAPKPSLRPQRSVPAIPSTQPAPIPVPSMPLPSLAQTGALVLQRHLVIGPVSKGKPANEMLPVSVKGGVVRVAADHPWLGVTPSKVDSRTQEVKIMADTSQLSLGRKTWPVNYQADEFLEWTWWGILKWGALHARFLVPVEREHKGVVTVGGQAVDVTVRLEPAWWQEWLGWGATGLAMAGELTGLGGLLFLLLGG